MDTDDSVRWRFGYTTPADHDAHEALLSENERSSTASMNDTAVPATLTLRATALGLLVGAIICFANTYFGLQAGFVNSMTLTSSLVAFGGFQAIQSKIRTPFTPSENALVVAISGSFGTMPWTIGLIGIVPALEYLITPAEGGPFHFTTFQLLVWTVGLSILGITIAPVLRDYFVVRQRLRFPVATSAATLIGLLYEDEHIADRVKAHNVATQGSKHSKTAANQFEAMNSAQWKSSVTGIWVSSMLASVLSLSSYFVPTLQSLPVFGLPLAHNWAWALSGSPAYVGMGMLVETSTIAGLTTGVIIGWAILSPIAKSQGWAMGPIRDWDTGFQGWIIWIALGIILGDAVVHLLIIFARLLNDLYNIASEALKNPPISEQESLLGSAGCENESSQAANLRPLDQGVPDRSIQKPVPKWTIFTWASITATLSISSMWILFHNFIPFWAILLAIALILPLCLVCIRAYGLTGTAAADTAGRFTQFVFALIIPISTPGAIIANMAVASIAEAGAWQTAELVDELKMGLLVGASQTALFYGQLMGSFVGAITASLVYRLYTTVYKIPGDTLPVPVAHMWYSSTKIMYHSGLPDGVWPFALAAFCLSSISSIVTALVGKPYTQWLPQAIPVAIGMYIKPEFTLARILGGLIRYVLIRNQHVREISTISFASGLILGDGVLSIVKFGLKSIGVPHL